MDEADFARGTESRDDELLDDATGPTGVRLSDIDARMLLTPAALGAVGGIVLGLLVLARPDPGSGLVGRLIGAVLVVVAGTGLWGAIRHRPRSLPHAAIALAVMIAGSQLVISPSKTAYDLARFIGIVLVLLGAFNLLRPWWRPGDLPIAFWLSSAIALAGTGALLLAFPDNVILTLVDIIAVGWVLASLTVLVATLDPRTPDVGSYRSVVGLVRDWLDHRRRTGDERRTLADKVYMEGETATPRLVRFALLMSFAAVLASMGVITDSTAVVIGAMLLAPLMTPLMGISLAISMGWPRRLRRSVFTALGGLVIAVTIGWLLGSIVPTVIDTGTNAQILSRTSPTGLDLIIALTAGAAGAYALSRPEVSDSLPGVAIAISLVPPLTVVGICMSQGDWVSAFGALLLFATNVLGIVVLGGVVFVVTGVAPIRRIAENQHRVRTAVMFVAASGVLVLFMLLFNGDRLRAGLIDQSRAERVVYEWVGQYPGYTIEKIAVQGDRVMVKISGPVAGAPTADDLVDHLTTGLGRSVTADLRLLVEERSVVAPRGAP